MPKAAKRKPREPFGRVRKLPSGRYQAGYIGPDLALHHPSATFAMLMDARGWLAAERRKIDVGAWTPPSKRNQGLPPRPSGPSPSPGWRIVRSSQGPATSTVDCSTKRFCLRSVTSSSETSQASWSASGTRLWTRPSRRAEHTPYALLLTILGSAVTEGLITANPCHIRGAGSSKRVHEIKPATLGELETIVTDLPDRYSLLVLLASWCALRFGELIELRRQDIDLKAGKIMVRRAVTVVDGEPIIGLPKSDAGMRDVAIPPHLLPAVKDHLNRFAASGRDGLIFPAAVNGRHLGHGTFFKTWDKARRAAGRPDLRFHDLRHTGAVLAAQTGATLAELMNRLGHSTPAMAIRYQHASSGRDAEIARLLSRMVEAT